MSSRRSSRIMVLPAAILAAVIAWGGASAKDATDAPAAGRPAGSGDGHGVTVTVTTDRTSTVEDVTGVAPAGH